MTCDNDSELHSNLNLNSTQGSTTSKYAANYKIRNASAHTEMLSCSPAQPYLELNRQPASTTIRIMETVFGPNFGFISRLSLTSSLKFIFLSGL